MPIRIATADDLPALVALNSQVQAKHAAVHPDIFKSPEDEQFAAAIEPIWREQLSQPGWLCFVAEIEGRVAGYILARRVERPENPFAHPLTTMVIDQIGIDPTYQGLGYGVRLLESVREVAEGEGIGILTLDVWAFNARAAAFFEKMGYTVFSERRWLKLF